MFDNDYNRSVMQQTLAIIKPDAVAARHTGRIIQRIEEAVATAEDVLGANSDETQG